MNLLNHIDNVVTIIGNSEMTDEDKTYCLTTLYKVMFVFNGITNSMMYLTAEEEEDVLSVDGASSA